MTLGEITISFLGLVAGYLAVSWLMDRAGGGRRGNAGPAPSRSSESFATKGSATPSPEVTLGNWYRVLGVPENAAKDAIMAAYEKRMADCNAKILGEGIGAEARAAARQQATQLQAAYAIGMRLFS